MNSVNGFQFAALLINALIDRRRAWLLGAGTAAATVSVGTVVYMTGRKKKEKKPAEDSAPARPRGMMRAVRVSGPIPKPPRKKNVQFFQVETEQLEEDDVVDSPEASEPEDSTAVLAAETEPVVVAQLPACCWRCGSQIGEPRRMCLATEYSQFCELPFRVR